jgi:opacity protein-like surface antigen
VKQRIWLMATALLGLLAGTSAMALESGFYLGAFGAQASIDLDKAKIDGEFRDPLATEFSSKLDDFDSAYGIVLGGQFGRWFAVEAQLIDLGEIHYSVTQSGRLFPGGPVFDSRYGETVEAAAVTLSGILTVPIGDRFVIGLRAGVAVNATETSYRYEERFGSGYFTDEDDGSTSDSGMTYGIIFEWAPTQHLGLRLEYQRITKVGGDGGDFYYFEDDEDYFEDFEKRDGEDVDLFSLSVLYRF